MKMLQHILTDNIISIILEIAIIVSAFLTLGTERIEQGAKKRSLKTKKIVFGWLSLFFALITILGNYLKDSKTSERLTVERGRDSTVNLTRYAALLNRSMRIIDTLDTSLSQSRKQLIQTGHIISTQNKQSELLTKQLQTTVGILNQTGETLTNSKQTVQQLNGMITAFRDVRVEYGFTYSDSLKFFKNKRHQYLLSEALKTPGIRDTDDDNDNTVHRYYVANTTITRIIGKADSSLAEISFNMTKPRHTELDSLLPEQFALYLEFSKKIDTSQVSAEYDKSSLKLRSGEIGPRSADIKINPFRMSVDYNSTLKYVSKGDGTIIGASDLSNAYILITIQRRHMANGNFKLDYFRIYYGDNHMGKINIPVKLCKVLPTKSPKRVCYLYKFEDQFATENR